MVVAESAVDRLSAAHQECRNVPTGSNKPFVILQLYKKCYVLFSYGRSFGWSTVSLKFLMASSVLARQDAAAAAAAQKYTSPCKLH